MNEKKHFDLDGTKTLHISKADQKGVAAPPLNMEQVDHAGSTCMMFILLTFCSSAGPGTFSRFDNQFGGIFASNQVFGYE